MPFSASRTMPDRISLPQPATRAGRLCCRSVCSYSTSRGDRAGTASHVFHVSRLFPLCRHPGERYLIVASDPDSVGQRVMQIAGSTQGTTTMVGTGFVSIHTGSENTRHLTFAHNGTVTVALQPIPKLN